MTILVCALFASVRQSSALTVSLQPGSTAVEIGNTVLVDLVIDGLGNLTSPSLGAFDLDVTYDPSVLSAASVTFGVQLDLGAFGSLQSFDLSLPGQIHLDELSLETASDLDAAQPDSFVLATLEFVAVGPGLSAIEFDPLFATLSDAGANVLTGYSLGASAITVNRNPTAVSDRAGTGMPLLVTSSILVILRSFLSRIPRVQKFWMAP